MTSRMEMLYRDCVAQMDDNLAFDDCFGDLLTLMNTLNASLNQDQQLQLEHYLDISSRREEYATRFCFVSGMNAIAQLLMEALIGP